ncbi:MAG: hypothetical protein AMXMBFR33_53390 [Candidatus Xenobia bacterium]
MNARTGLHERVKVLSERSARGTYRCKNGDHWRRERIAGRANDFHARYQLDLKNNRCTVHTRQLTFCEKLSWRALPSTMLGAGVGAAVALLGSLGGLPVAGAALAGGLTGLWLWQALKAPSLQSFPE